jgi:hypothetical protein
MLDGISHGARSDCRKYNGVSEVQIGHSLYHGGQCPVAAFRLANSLEMSELPRFAQSGIRS